MDTDTGGMIFACFFLFGGTTFCVTQWIGQAGSGAARNGRTLQKRKGRIALPGFEPGLQDPKSRVLDH